MLRLRGKKNVLCPAIYILVSNSDQETMIFLEWHLRSKVTFREMRARKSN